MEGPSNQEIKPLKTRSADGIVSFNPAWSNWKPALLYLKQNSPSNSSTR